MDNKVGIHIASQSSQLSELFSCLNSSIKKIKKKKNTKKEKPTIQTANLKGNIGSNMFHHCAEYEYSQNPRGYFCGTWTASFLEMSHLQYEDSEVSYNLYVRQPF